MPYPLSFTPEQVSGQYGLHPSYTPKQATAFGDFGMPPVYNGPSPTVMPPSVMPSGQQMPPDMMKVYQQKMMAIMADPQKKALFLQLVQAAQAGQIQPMQLAEQLDKLVSAKGEPQKSILPAFLLASLFGVGLGQAVRSSLSQFERSDVKSSWLETGLKLVDNIPGVNFVNRYLEGVLDKRQAKFKSGHGNPGQLSRLLKFDSFYETEQLKREMVQRHFGPNGVYQAEMATMERDLKNLIAPEKLSEVLKHLRSTARHSELMQVLKPKAIYFVPASMRDYVKQYTSSDNGQKATLSELDQMISKNEFVKSLGETKLGREILQSQTNPLGQLIRDSRPQEFARVYHNSIVSNRDYFKQIEKAMGKPLPKAYPELRNLLGLKPYWDHIYDNLKGLLFDGDKPVSAIFSSKSTLATVDEKIAQYHVVKHLDQLTPWRIFMDQTKGFIKRFETFEKWHMPIMESCKAFTDQMKSKGVRPAGRVMGLLWYNFSRMFEGNHYQRWRLVNLLNKQSSGYLNRIFIAATIFGASVLLSQAGRPETKRSRFFDSIATGLGGFYGWELGKNILPQIEPLRNNTLAHLFSKQILRWPATVTVGGFINYFFLPFFVTSWLFGTLAQKPVHWMFGNPDKMERDLNKKDADKLMKQFNASAPNPTSTLPFMAPQSLPVAPPAYMQPVNYPQQINPYYYPYAGMNYYQSYSSYPGWNNYYSPWQYQQPALSPNPALMNFPKPTTNKTETQPAKSKIEPVSIPKASQKIPKVTYTLDTKSSMDRLSRNPLEDDARRSEEAIIRQLKSNGL